MGLAFLAHPIIRAAIAFGKGHIRLANVEKEIISETLFNNAQIPPRLPIPNNPVVLDEVQIKEESQDEEVPELESDAEEGQVMSIMEMEEEMEPQLQQQSEPELANIVTQLLIGKFVKYSWKPIMEESSIVETDNNFRQPQDRHNKDIKEGNYLKRVLQLSSNIGEQNTALKDNYKKKIIPEIVPILHLSQEWRAWVPGFT
uniref:Uncharacterized protein n=1 Tax=Romanomermis culicivorax TaxID=13658 RepID=A0A915JUP5_ROMCU